MIEEIHYFHEKIRFFEKELINFYVDINHSYGRAKKLVEVFAYFMIHKRLNQPILRKLTGFSRSTISSIVSELLDYQAIKTDGLQDKTKEYTIDLMYGRVILTKLDPRVLNVQYMNNLFDNAKNEGKTLLKSFEKSHWMKRIKDIEFIHNYYFDDTGIENRIWYLKQINLSPLREVHEFSQEFQEMEDKFHKHLIDLDYFQEHDKKSALLNCYFLTRECLNLTHLEQLTQYDRRTIQKRLDKIVDDGYISYDLQAKTFRMHSLTHSFGSGRRVFLKKLKKYKTKFSQYFDDFSQKTSELNVYHGYHYIIVQLMHALSELDKLIKLNSEDPLILAEKSI